MRRAESEPFKEVPEAEEVSADKLVTVAWTEAMPSKRKRTVPICDDDDDNESGSILPQFLGRKQRGASLWTHEFTIHRVQVIADVIKRTTESLLVIISMTPMLRHVGESAFGETHFWRECFRLGV